MAFGAVEGGRNYPLLQLTRICRHLASGRRMDGGTSDWFNMRLDRLTTPQESAVGLSARDQGSCCWSHVQFKFLAHNTSEQAHSKLESLR